MPSFMTSAALAALSIAPAVYAHGYVSSVTANGKTYEGGSPEWFYASEKPDSVGWYAENQDNGFVAPSAYTSPDIICHKSATPGNKVVEVEAGSEIEIKWNTWPESHHGPVTNYLARCHGDCTKIDEAKKEKLTFFAIQSEGLKSDGTWAADAINAASDYTAKVTIPSNIQGNFVLRHEIIALHSANNEDGAQNYPQCINLKVTGSGKAHPCNQGADCRKGTGLYTPTDAGILVNIYGSLSSYKIPGPAVFRGLQKRLAQVFRA